jgi:UDP-2-acetamido-3-amino-2,3-dideoxy-glucuronate N-acetyltransferase
MGRTNQQEEAPQIHPMALCETTAVGPRTRVWAFAHLLPGAVIGADCNVCDHAFIEGGARVGDRVTIKNSVLLWDGVTIEDDVFVGPNAVFTNDLYPRAHVRRGATIGANATIVCGTTIGPSAMVGAGSVVLQDVPARALVVGNPARRVGWVCDCGARLTESLNCRCGRAFVERSGGLEPIVL